MNEDLVVDTLRLLCDRLQKLESQLLSTALDLQDHRARALLDKHSNIEAHPNKKMLKAIDAQLIKLVTDTQQKQVSTIGASLRYEHVHDAVLGDYYRKYPIPPEKMKQIQDQYNAYLWTLTQNKEFHIKIAEPDVFIMTPLSFAISRNYLLSKWFPCNGTIVDIGAGSGTDTLSMVFHLAPSKVYAVEDDSNIMRNMRLKDNVKNFAKTYNINPDKFEIFTEGAEHFFRSMRGSTIHLVYVDPPWVMKGQTHEATPEDIVRFVYDTTLKPMLEYDVNASIICIKLRYEWEKVSHMLDMINAKISDPSKHFRNIMQFQCVPFKRTIYFNVIKNNTADVSILKPDMIYDAVYNHKELPEGFKINHEKPVWDFEAYKAEHMERVNSKRKDLIAKRKGYSTSQELEEVQIFNEKRLYEDEDWRVNTKKQESTYAEPKNDDGWHTVAPKGKRK